MTTSAPSSVEPLDQPRVQRRHVRLDRGHAGLLHEPEAGDAGVDVRHRRRSRVEAAGRRVGRVVGDVHLEDVLVGEPAGLRRRQPREHLAPHPEKAEAGGGEQVLDRSARDEVGTERAHVDLDRARRLVAVGENERPVRVGDLGDRRHVVAVARAIRDRRAADEGGALVDRLGESLGRDRPVGVGTHVHHLGAAKLLRVGDLADRRELVLADHDAVAAAALERERRDDAVDALRDGGRHRHLVGIAVEQARRSPRGQPPSARPRTPTRRRSRPSRRGTPRRPRAPGATALPGSRS